MNSQQNKKNLTTQQIQKQILYWNLNALKDVIAYSDMIDRVQKKIKPNQHDLEIRDFFFTNKLTIDGKFQPESFIQKSIAFLKNFVSMDKNLYLQSVNFQNNVKKFRFWKNIVSTVPKDSQTHEARQSIEKIIWAYRIPTFALFASLTYVFMMVVGFTKMKKGKQLVTLMAALYAADMFVQRHKLSEIFYTIPELKSKQLQKRRKQLINESIVLDGQVYILDKEKGYESRELVLQAKSEEDQAMKKALLESAGYDVLDSSEKVI